MNIVFKIVQLFQMITDAKHDYNKIYLTINHVWKWN